MVPTYPTWMVFQRTMEKISWIKLGRTTVRSIYRLVGFVSREATQQVTCLVLSVCISVGNADVIINNKGKVFSQ